MKTLNYSNEKCKCIYPGSLIALCIILTFSIGTFAQSPGPDFSGKWILNVEKSQLMQARNAHTRIIEQNDNLVSMYLVYSSVGGQDSATLSFTYNVDGVRSYDADEYYEEETITAWNENGRGFYEEGYYADDLWDIYESARTDFELSEDLKTLTITAKQYDEITEILVYDKAGN